MVTTILPLDRLPLAERATVTIRLNMEELELVELSLRALGYAPGHDYGQVQAARALADSLRLSAVLDVGEPVAAR
jgi:hypothetical protein